MTLTNKVAQFDADSDLVNAWVHGPASGAGSTVTTDSGAVRTPAKLIADNEAEIQAVVDLAYNWANGPITGTNSTVTMGGASVKSPAKLIDDKNIEINQGAASVLALSTAQADISIAQAGIATTQAELATSNGAAQVTLATAQVTLATTEKTAALAAKVAAESARDSALIQAGVHTTEALGRAAVVDGAAFKVQGLGDIAAYEYRRIDAATSVLIATYPSATITSQTVNRGKAFPFRSMVRDGITSVASSIWNDLILNVKVTGATPGFYYQIAYQQNEGNIGGNIDFGWIINEFASTTFATASVATLAHNHSNTAPNIVRTGGIQTVSFALANRPNVWIDITLDASKLPAAGSPIIAHDANTRAAWSWIIDPSCYAFATPVATAIAAAPVSPAVTAAIAANNAARNALLVNQGVAYPLRSMVRDGITSAASTVWNDLILDVQVFNAVVGEYYQIGYLQNEALLAGESTFDWKIYAFDAATYSTASVRTTLIDYTSSFGLQQQLVRTGGIQKISLYPQNRTGMRIDITVDASKLPPAATPINSFDVNTRAAWSWIIDPSCYVVATTVFDSLRINQGLAMPNKILSRNGETSSSNSLLKDCILDMRVIGAREGFYYGLRYFKNGTTLLSGPADGWIIEEQAIATYNTTAAALTVLNYTDPAPDITRSGIQTVHLISPVVEGMEFYITLDTDRLSAYGGYYSMLYTGYTGYSWIIDPSCYTYSTSITDVVSDTISYSSDALGNMQLIWQSSEYLYRLRFGPNGYNSLPNIEGIDFALLGNRSTATFTQLNTAGTDWLPPMVVQAVNNGDGHGMVYTGGNHGADGTAGGGSTARNVLYQIYADGQPMAFGTVFSGDAKKITAVIANELSAYNTTGVVDAVNFPQRYVLRQAMIVDMYAGGIEVKTEVRAYENIIVKTDNGPQMVTGGFQETLLYVGGQYEDRIAFNSATSSGTKLTYPNTWALVLQSASGQQVSWMDRTYEAGDGRYVHETASYIRGGGATNTKFYHAAVAAYSHNMAANATYKWRGGYSWQAPSLEGNTFDSSFVFWKGGQQHHALIESASKATVLP